MSPCKRTKGIITIHEDAALTRLKAMKLPTTCGKVKKPAPLSLEASSHSDGVYAAHFNTFESQGENQDP